MTMRRLKILIVIAGLFVLLLVGQTLFLGFKHEAETKSFCGDYQVGALSSNFLERAKESGITRYSYGTKVPAPGKIGVPFLKINPAMLEQEFSKFKALPSGGAMVSSDGFFSVASCYIEFSNGVITDSYFKIYRM